MFVHQIISAADFWTRVEGSDRERATFDQLNQHRDLTMEMSLISRSESIPQSYKFDLFVGQGVVI